MLAQLSGIDSWVNNKLEVREGLIIIIKKEVEDTFGRKVRSFKDCAQLSEEIYFRSNCQLNPNTLRRFFGLVKAEYPPSLSTLNIMSKYCGFNSLDDVYSNRKISSSQPNPDNSLFVQYLVSLFSEGWPDSNNETYLSLVKHTIQYIIKHPEIADSFQKEVAKTKRGRHYYFEQFVNLDKLNGYFGEGLKHYLNQTNDSESRIFGHSLLCFSSWLVSDKVSMKKNFEEIKRLKPARNAEPSFIARYFAAHIYYAEMNGLDMESILIAAHEDHALIAPDNNTGMFPFFEYLLSTSLLLTGQFSEALYYVDFALKNYPAASKLADKGLFKTLHLYKALLL
ncbi:MAG: hypothetical protein ACJ748_16700, partial [Flavisolibacter sp.]